MNIRKIPKRITVYEMFHEKIEHALNGLMKNTKVINLLVEIVWKNVVVKCEAND